MPPFASRGPTEALFDRKPGDKPALDEAENKDVVACLNTLTDGHKAPNAAPETATTGVAANRQQAMLATHLRGGQHRLMRDQPGTPARRK